MGILKGMNRARLQSVELFAGGGGLAKGLELAGFGHLALVEWDRQSCATLRSNAGTAATWTAEQIIETDVRALDLSTFHSSALLAAGVPCQPFSLAGVHRGNNDNRNMFPQVLRAVREIQPRAILIENVVAWPAQPSRSTSPIFTINSGCRTSNQSQESPGTNTTLAYCVPAESRCRHRSGTSSIGD